MLSNWFIGFLFNPSVRFYNGRSFFIWGGVIKGLSALNVHAEKKEMIEFINCLYEQLTSTIELMKHQHEIICNIGDRLEGLESRNDKARDLFRSIMNMLDNHTKQLKHLHHIIKESAESPTGFINDRSESKLDNTRSQIILIWVFIALLTIVNIKPFLLDVWYLLHFIGHLIYSTGHSIIRH